MRVDRRKGSSRTFILFTLVFRSSSHRLRNTLHRFTASSPESMSTSSDSLISSVQRANAEPLWLVSSPLPSRGAEQLRFGRSVPASAPLSLSESSVCGTSRSPRARDDRTTASAASVGSTLDVSPAGALANTVALTAIGALTTALVRSLISSWQ
ncbi:hypothetical protein PF008_g21257 [Phytophthora fragariae]|uniref:Uncharacterized protein n=1 Tax=Phytophthora fragariae TaxID=53985 RepID=A0A6G0QXU7_9STRA|nr:hypothetical protein PF008_g21257 [Phytophthora fragariae]